MNLRKCTIPMGLLILFISIFSLATPKEWTPESPQIHFVAIGKPAMLKIKGKSEELKGSLTSEGTKLSGHLVLNLSTLVTGIDTRDSHMKEKYLEVGQFPTAELNIKDLQLNSPLENLNAPITETAFSGELTLHGQKQNIKGTYSLALKGTDKIGVLTQFSINLTDYKIEIPSYMGIKVADKVEIEVQFDLKK